MTELLCYDLTNLLVPYRGLVLNEGGHVVEAVLDHDGLLGLHLLALLWAALLVKRYLSNTTSFVLRAVYSVDDHHNSPKHSPFLKRTCLRQVV